MAVDLDARLTRRQFLKLGAAAAATGAAVAAGCGGLLERRAAPVLVNDTHAQINPTWVRRLARPHGIDALQRLVADARRHGESISIAGARHAMGGQQFGADTVLVDMNGMDRVIALDAANGCVEAEAGITWPALMTQLVNAQQGQPWPWTIRQKQTGANRLTLGGALASNIHSRALAMAPIIGDVEAFSLVDAEGEVRRCSRAENPELFRLAIGGYGLFGIIASVRLRLAPRIKLERVVTLLDVEELMSVFQDRIQAGFLYGDFQFAVDHESDQFLRRGILSCYRPADQAAPMPAERVALSVDDWKELVYLAHVNPSRAFDRYASHYLATSGELYWSDEQQISTYVADYHAWLDRRMGATEKATEILTEVYIPRAALVPYLTEVRADFRRSGASVIYGTIRLIERDDESFLPWAKQPYACIIFNLHTVHTPDGFAKSAQDFRLLIDRAIRYGGSFYLTYHRFATRRQVEACYPQFADFLRFKYSHDPEGLFQSEWYRHYKRMFTETL